VSAETVLKTSLPEVATSDGVAEIHDAGTGPESEKAHAQHKEDNSADGEQELADLQAEYNDGFRKLMQAQEDLYNRTSDDFIIQLDDYIQYKRHDLGSAFAAQEQALEDRFGIHYLKDNMDMSKFLAEMREWFSNMRDDYMSKGVDPDPRVGGARLDMHEETDAQGEQRNEVDEAQTDGRLNPTHEREGPKSNHSLSVESNYFEAETYRGPLDNFVINMVLDELPPFAGRHPEDGTADSMVDVDLRLRNFQRIRGPRIVKWRDDVHPGRPPSESACDNESDLGDELLGEVSPLMSEYCREGTEWRRACIKARREECSSSEDGSEI
jgi:hypothetical protein